MALTYDASIAPMLKACVDKSVKSLRIADIQYGITAHRKNKNVRTAINSCQHILMQTILFC